MSTLSDLAGTSNKPKQTKDDSLFGTGSLFKMAGLPEVGVMGSTAPHFDTELTPEQEKEFLKWKAKNAPQDSGMDYDLKGFFLSGGGKDARGHGSDKYKKPNHPTFSNESQYHGKNDQNGGRWEEKDGKTYFYASPTNLKYHSPEELQKYFKEVEPDVTLVLP